MNRRRFLKSSALSTGAAAALLGATTDSGISAATDFHFAQPPDRADSRPKLPDLAPARWLWYPSERTLQNTFILFRRELILSATTPTNSGVTAPSPPCSSPKWVSRVSDRSIPASPAPKSARYHLEPGTDLTLQLRHL